MDLMFLIAEIDIICIFIVCILFSRIENRNRRKQQSYKFFSLILGLSIVITLLDMFHFLTNGRQEYRVFNIISNTCYYFCLLAICLLWMIYLFIKIDYYKKLKPWHKTIIYLPFIIVGVNLLINPWTKLLFSVDENGYYSRENLNIIFSIGAILYPLVSEIISLVKIRNTKSVIDKSKYVPLLVFPLISIIGAFIQFGLNGYPITHIGIILSLLLYADWERQVLLKIDNLTGISNRFSFEEKKDKIIASQKNSNVTFFMIDVNKFKKINDNYGHKVGDDVLKCIAMSIKSATSVSDKKMTCYRLGGDEFAVLASDLNEENINKFINDLNSSLSLNKKEKNYSFNISLSIGYHSMRISNEEEFNQLTKTADELMYKSKEMKYKSDN